MQISFENQSSQAIRLTMQGNSHVLPSGKTAMLNIDDREPIFAHVDQYTFLRKKDKSYRLVVETEYRLEGLTEGCRILLTREHIAIDVNMSYDRVFLHPTEGRITHTEYQVVNHPNVKKQMQKDNLADSALWWPLGDIFGEVLLDLLFHPLRTILCITLAIGIGIYFGWYWILIVLLGLFFIHAFINIIIDPALEKATCKAMGVPTPMEALKNHCTPEALSAFYSQPEREAFAGKPVDY